MSGRDGESERAHAARPVRGGQRAPSHLQPAAGVRALPARRSSAVRAVPGHEHPKEIHALRLFTGHVDNVFLAVCVAVALCGDSQRFGANPRHLLAAVMFLWL